MKLYKYEVYVYYSDEPTVLKFSKREDAEEIVNMSKQVGVVAIIKEK